ncbi:recombinase family protein [Agrobacterium vitis]|uniref:recombinase family protein n=1 Tax=Agrobacterium vitis TaxID=373 RepID=UPI000AA51525|nr:recombinase family protein [Agrobacterium vitis]WEO71557.1 recombinase family protein [Agrobacterium vitis]
MKVALYARYSSDNQRDASIEDQLRICRTRAEREGWTIVDSYTDRAISGASLIRPGIQELIADGLKRRFDVILTESLDRLSRDQEDIAGLYKRMRFAGVSIVTLSEGEVSELHIGLKGTMGALYLKDLADKTRRGLRGRVEEGQIRGRALLRLRRRAARRTIKRNEPRRAHHQRAGSQYRPADFYGISGWQVLAHDRHGAERRRGARAARQRMGTLHHSW